MSSRYPLTKRTRGLTLLLGCAILFAAAPGAVAQDAAAPDRPNFVFVFADDWGWGDLGCYGHPRLKTPNLDRLAKQGILFTQFYVCSGVCSPSRTAIMTGHFPARHRIHGHIADHKRNLARGMPDFLDPDVTTVTDLLKEAGYATGHFGKWHLGSGKDAPTPKAYGIDDHRIWVGNGNTWDTKGEPGWRAYSTEWAIDETIRFIEEHKDRPFYVQAWLLDTHARLTPTEEQMEPYKNHLGALKVYYSAATAADAQIGRLLKRLDELKLADNTVVIFSSDNGPEDIEIRNASEHGVGSAGPFRGRKRSLYEGGIRVPFIVRWPKVTPAGKIDNQSVIAGVDWMPTICALAGMQHHPHLAPGSIDGEDRSAALRGHPLTNHVRPLFWEWRFRIFGHVINRSPMLATRFGSWKLLMNPDRSRVELYDLSVDPSELRNLADEAPDVVESRAESLLRWHATLPKGPVETYAGSNAYPWPK